MSGTEQRLGESIDNLDNAPEWFTIGAPLMWNVIGAGAQAAHSFSAPDPNLSSIPSAAVWFLGDAMALSVDVNKKGKHAHAMMLNRCCLESLTIAELGFLGPSGLSLLNDWQTGKKSQGEIRKALAQTSWTKYRAGIWGETWIDFMSQLCKAVQPYSHYTPDLMEWQRAVMHEVPAQEKDGKLTLLMKIGPDTYDKEKATAITLYQCVIVWALGRILMEHALLESSMSSSVTDLGQALAIEPILAKRHQDWSFIFWPHTFTVPRTASRDEWD